MRNCFPDFEVRFLEFEIKDQKQETYNKSGNPNTIKMKILPSQSPSFPKRLEDFMSLSSIAPAWL